MTYPWLTHSDIDGGSKIDIMGRTQTFDFNNFITIPQEAGKNTGSNYNFRLAYVDYTGHDNPKYVIEGTIMSGLSANNEGSLAMTFHRLGSFAMIGSPIWFYDTELMLNPAGSTAVLVDSFKVEKPINDARPYSMTLFETKTGASWT